MKLVYTYCIYFFLVSSICYGQELTTLNNEERETIRNEINEMFEKYHDDLIDNGIKSMIKYLYNSKDFFWVLSGNNSPSNYQEVSKLILSHHPQVTYLELDWKPLHIQPIDKNIAVYTGIIGVIQQDTLNVKKSFRVIESGTLIKHNGEWKFLSGQSRSLPKN